MHRALSKKLTDDPSYDSATGVIEAIPGASLMVGIMNDANSAGMITATSIGWKVSVLDVQGVTSHTLTIDDQCIPAGSVPSNPT